MSIHPDTAIGTVALTVTDLARSRDFYERVLGLRGVEREDGTLALGVEREMPLIELTADSSAPPLNRRATGLFHLAVLLPTRRELALALRRLIQTRWPLDGASDHLVSEALYLSDPDGNGIEIYHDRERAEWPRADGKLQLPTLPLDLEGVLSELRASEAGSGIGVAGEAERHVAPRDTRIGHVHLQVADLADAEAFYCGALGFDVTVRGYPGALFVSAGGYHHHIGLNTWYSAGAAPPARGAVGLRAFQIELPAAEELERTLAGAAAAGVHGERRNGTARLRDPSGNTVLLTTSER